MKALPVTALFQCLLFVLPLKGAIVFDDFSTVTVLPTTSGSLTTSGFTLTLTGDSGAHLSDFANGSTNGLVLANNSSNRIYTLTLNFSDDITIVSLNLDAMHALQFDRITTSDGDWTTVPASLNKNGQTLEALGAIVNPGGAGVDDDLDVTLTFPAPTDSVTFTGIGAFVLDSVTVVPEPSTGLLALIGFAGLVLPRRRRR